MPKLSELVAALDEAYPFAEACSYDNVGLLVGRADKKIDRVLVVLDVTSAVVEEATALGVDLILSHHPVIFRELKKVTDQSYTGGLVLELAEKGLAAIALHTNFDRAEKGNNDALALALGATEYERLEEGFAAAFDLPEELTFDDFAEEVRERLGDSVIRTIGGGKVKKVITACGAGISEELIFLARQTGAVIVTGDVKHNYATMARDLGVRLVETTHYGSEWVFTERMVKYLTENFKTLEVFVSQKNINPYDVA